MQSPGAQAGCLSTLCISMSASPTPRTTVSETTTRRKKASTTEVQIPRSAPRATAPLCAAHLTQEGEWTRVVLPMEEFASLDFLSTLPHREISVRDLWQVAVADAGLASRDASTPAQPVGPVVSTSPPLHGPPAGLIAWRVGLSLPGAPNSIWSASCIYTLHLLDWKHGVPSTAPAQSAALDGMYQPHQHGLPASSRTFCLWGDVPDLS